MSKRIDRTGQRFGKMLVLAMIYGEKSNSGKYITKCKCKCDCGNEKIVSLDSLKRSGDNASCGCDLSERRSKSQRVDLTGKRFGRLVVQEMIYNVKPSKCKCICDCGNVKIVTGADLSIGHTQSCGCLQKENATKANLKDFTGYVSPYGVKILKRWKQTPRGVWKWECECGICGKHFYEIPAKIKNGHTRSCGCALESSGERYVERMLNDRHVQYKTQYSFSDCKYKNILKFDFAIFSNDKLLFLVEYDGRQHFVPIDFFGGDEGFKDTKCRDEIKNNYCRIKGLPLLRLPYTLKADEIKDTFDKFYKSVETAGDVWQQAS